MTATAYDVHPGVAMVRKWADELPAKTGRTHDEWADLVRRCEGRDRRGAEVAQGRVRRGRQLAPGLPGVFAPQDPRQAGG